MIDKLLVKKVKKYNNIYTISVFSVKTSETKDISLSDVIEQNIISQFTGADKDYLTNLYYSHLHNCDGSYLKTLKGLNYKANIVMTAGVLFAIILVAANVFGAKIVTVMNTELTAGIVFFPLTYAINNFVTEIFGFQTSRRVVWAALAANLIFAFCSFIVIQMPPSQNWGLQQSYIDVLGTSYRILASSITAYIISEFLNATMISKLKVKFKGQFFAARATFSAFISLFIDTAIFNTLAFSFILPWKVIIILFWIEYIIKVLFQIITLPILIKIANNVRNKTGIDHFDLNISYNPFSFKLIDNELKV
jgi:queuosine precursor transporter